MVYRGVPSPHENWSPLCGLTPSPSPLKIMILKPHPHLFAPPNPIDMITMTRHLI